jgi:hypothetical protein
MRELRAGAVHRQKFFCFKISISQFLFFWFRIGSIFPIMGDILPAKSEITY